jgi:hypothetical protein
VDSWKKPIGPDWFAKPTSPQTSGFSCSRLSLHCSRACAAETRSAHSCSLLQDCRARLHLRCAAFALLPHQRPPIWLRVVCCPAQALACKIEPSRPLAKHLRSHSRTRRFNFARTSRSCNFAVLSICCDAIRFDLPLPPVLHCTSNPRRVAPASISAWVKGARRA